MGASIAPTQLAGVLALPRQRSGLASACIAATRQGGTALGIAVLGLIIATAAGVPGSPSYGDGFVHGLHIAGIVSGALTIATAALLAATAAKRTSPAGQGGKQAPAARPSASSAWSLRCASRR